MSDVRAVDVVFLRRNIPEAFTYRVDPEVHEVESWVGQPVVVPLSSDLTIGVVVDARAGEDDGDLKPVRSVLSSPPPLPEELVDVGRWVADYYLSSVHAVFSSILPPRYLPEPVPGWTLGEDASADGLDGSLREHFEEGGTVLLPEVTADDDADRETVEARVEEYAEGGVLEPAVRLEDPRVTSRKLNYVKLRVDAEYVRRNGADLSERQRELVEHLSESEQGEYQKDLPDPLSRSRLLQKMEEEDVIAREKRMYRRIPHPSARGDDGYEEVELTGEQESTVSGVRESLEQQRFDVHLVHGVTGSGKTEVYFRLIEDVLDRGETALVLVPEITLASFMVSQFRSRFGSDLGLLHSGLSRGERYDEWRRVIEGDARVVLGVQSAAFAPLRNLGLIVVDEEHDTSYKAGQSPRYHARDTAVVRGRKANVPVVLGSATPSLESYSNALKGRYRKHEMEERPVGGEMPTVNVTDLKGTESLLTDSLVESTRSVLDRGNRAIWFYNRRGVSNFLLCGECGEVVECRRCNVSLTLHRNPRRLRCHYCGYNRSVPDVCGECGAEELEPVGSGTQTLAEKARNLFEDADVIRMDRDTVSKKDSRFRKLREFGRSSPALLVGTQMVTKGLDYENVEFVGVVLADTGLQFPDFRSGERTFQQLVQVCGRAGRKEAGSSVLVQTYNPGHYAVLNGKNADYESFAAEELQNRKPLEYPPFARLINVVARGKQEEDVSRVLNGLRHDLPDAEDVRWLGPSPCGIDYVDGNYRWHLMARGHFDRSWKRTLREKIDEYSNRVRLIADVDPIEIH